VSHMRIPMSEQAWLTRLCSVISMLSFMLLIIYLVFKSIPINILPLFTDSQYYHVLYWPGIVTLAAMAHPPNVMERSTVDN